MRVLVIGLILFLGVHSVRAFADGWRTRMIARLGPGAWKGLYTVASLAGLALIIWGFGLARQYPLVVYTPAAWLRHLNALFTLVAFILVVAAYVPRNHLKAAIGHPMLAGVKTWAFGHLLATGMARDLALFGAFLAWSVVMFAVSRRRDRANGVTYPAGSVTGDVLTAVIGAAAWAAFAFLLHARWIGVNPFQ